jgi:YHS domain-containing protein
MVLAGMLLAAASNARGEDTIPPEFAPFEHLIGAWKGQGIPRANRLKGWAERHLWAWKFQEGRPAGLSIELDGDRTISRATLSYDEVKKRYRFEGNDPDGRPVAFVGPIDAKGQTLILDRQGKAPDGSQRLTIRLNSNRIRYTMLLEAKAPGAPQYAKLIDVNLGKEGESFAAGGSSEDLPRCIVTGGAATLSATYQGKTYPLCCTGCRDEFDENPEKYARKMALRMQAGDDPAKSPPAPSRGRDDDVFDGLVEDHPRTAPKADDAPATRKGGASSKSEQSPTAKPPSDPEGLAAGRFQAGQALEKSGKSQAARKQYESIVKDFPGTKAARDAAARIKALGGR